MIYDHTWITWILRVAVSTLPEVPHKNAPRLVEGPQIFSTVELLTKAFSVRGSTAA